MRRHLLSLITILLPLWLPTIAQAKGWRGIVPLKSTRADVERLLGVPGKHGRYQFDNERAYVNYAGGGPCNSLNGCLCLVPKDTVISINVELEVEMSFSKLDIDKKKYEKYISPQNPAITTYSNDEEGIIYTVNEELDDVTAIEYLPTAKDCKNIIRSGKCGPAQRRHHKTRRLSLLGLSCDAVRPKERKDELVRATDRATRQIGAIVIFNKSAPLMFFMSPESE